MEEANRTLKKISAEVCKQTGLRAFGSGGAMACDVKELDLSFIKKDLVDIDQARVYYVTTALIALNTVNANKVLRPYLHNYPFKLKNFFTLSIHFLDCNSDDPKPPLIARVMNSKDIIEYEIKPKDDPFKFIVVHQETLEEAIQIVSKESAINLLRKPK